MKSVTIQVINVYELDVTDDEWSDIYNMQTTEIAKRGKLIVAYPKPVGESHSSFTARRIKAMSLLNRDGPLDTMLTMLAVGMLCVPYLLLWCPLVWLADHAKGISE